MPSLIKKYIGKQVYWYARECQRIEGKPKIVWQKYLGKADDIVQAITQTHRPEIPEPIEVTVADFGAVAAVYDMATHANLMDIIDRHVPKRDQGLSVGFYITLAAINRAVCPKSKVKLGPWYMKTILRRLMPADPKSLTSQLFWDHMDKMDEEKIAAIEADLSAHLVNTFNLKLRQLVYDPTNFFTYINTKTDSDLAQRGVDYKVILTRF
jgi:hypothetical protein